MHVWSEFPPGVPTDQLLSPLPTLSLASRSAIYGSAGRSQGSPGGTGGKELTCQCRRLRDMGSSPGLRRSPGGGHGNPPWVSCLGNSMDRGAWWATVHRVAKSQTWLKWLSTQARRKESRICPHAKGDQPFDNFPVKRKKKIEEFYSPQTLQKA